MTQPSGPRVHVAPPTFTSLPFGLLNALATEVRSPVDQHWRTGVTWRSLCAQADTTFDECFAVSGTAGAAPPPPGPKSETAEIEYRGATPFTVYVEIDCSAPGFWDDAQNLTEQAFARAEEHEIETAFWTGLANGRRVVFPHLAANVEILDNRGITLQTAATVIATGTPGLLEGLGELEGALADCYHGVGYIHVPREVIPFLADRMNLIQEGPRYRTPNGNVVVPGSGYANTSPAGVAAAEDTAWIYATGGIFIYRSAIDTTPPISTLDRSSNLVSVIAERTYVVGFECCHLAVNVSLGE